MNICNVKTCKNKQIAKGFCRKHYTRLKKHGDPLKIFRRENGHIDKKGNIVLYKPQHPNSSKSGKIYEHLYVMSSYLNRKIEKNETVIHIDGNRSNNNINNLKLYKKNILCSINGCKNKQRCKKLCEKHYSALRRNGDPNCFKKAVKGSGTITSQGYKRIWKPNHPNANQHGVIFEHRYVMSEFLGRPLKKHENIHHKNGDRLDNRIENLELWIISQPKGQNIFDLISWAKEIVDIYNHDICILKNKKKEHEKA